MNDNQVKVVGLAGAFSISAIAIVASYKDQQKFTIAEFTVEKVSKNCDLISGKDTFSSKNFRDANFCLLKPGDKVKLYLRKD